jgi:hypothetical protein
VACFVPSDLVMVPSVPVTPAPAVAGPFTGGQYVEQDPLHFEVVDVSGTNQYKVKPLELVTTFVPLIVAVIRAELEAGVDAGVDAAALLAGAAGLLLEADELPELPHAATTRAIAASPAAPHMFRILSYLPS